jgi:tetratricopeptide (TPR) repeat protein
VQDSTIKHDSNRRRGRRTGVDIDPVLLRQAREEAGLSLAEVAGTELTRQVVHLYEMGKARPSRRSLLIVSERLGRTPESFMRPVSPTGEPERAALDELERLIQAHEYELVLEQALPPLEGPLSEVARASFHRFAGQALLQLNRLADAIPHLRTAVRLAETGGNPWLAAEAMDLLALAVFSGDGEQALELAEEALGRYRRLPGRIPEVEARMLEHIGTFLSRRRAFQRAQASYEEALAVVGAVRDIEEMARIHHGLAGCHRATGDLPRAVERMQLAEALYTVDSELRPAVARVQLAKAHNDLSMLLMEQGRLDRADELLQSALEMAEQAGLERAYVQHSLAEVRRRQGRPDEAFQYVEEAMRFAQEHGHTGLLAASHRTVAELYEAAARHAEADANFARALDILAGPAFAEQRTAFLRSYQHLLDERLSRLEDGDAITGTAG